MASSRRVALLASLALLAAARPVRGADVYGKPLRGLTQVPVREAVAEPERFAGADIRVAGRNEGPEGRPELKEGEAVLPIVTDGSYALPAKLEGSELAAEGFLRKSGNGVVFVASGVEVSR